MPQPVLNVIAEDPQIEHVAQQVQPAAVHEHGGKQCYRIPDGVGKKAPRHERPALDKRISVIKL
jgi:hypothetical protein